MRFSKLILVSTDPRSDEKVGNSLICVCAVQRDIQDMSSLTHRLLKHNTEAPYIQCTDTDTTLIECYSLSSEQVTDGILASCPSVS